MAEFVSGIAVLVLHRLSSIACREICLVRGLKGDLKKLKDSMSIINDVLLDAEEKQAHDKRISSWLTQIKDVFLDAEDVLDEFECEKQRRKLVKEHGTTGRKVRRFISCSNPLFFLLNLAHTVKNLRKRLEQLHAACRDFNLSPRPEEITATSKNGREDSFVDPSIVIGRKVDKEKIINLLIDRADNSNSQLLSVIPIYGFPGMGKTTLARLVYNDERVKRWFDLKMWVSVSKVFDIPRLIKKIIDSATRKTNEGLNHEQSQNNLRDLLKGKKFLLVLDNVWNDDRRKWVELRSFLEGCSRGSKIIVTTRNEEVAKRMGTASSLHELKGLRGDDCLSMFLKHAFEERQDIKPPQNLINIAQKIVDKKCNGIPWVVVTLGSLLYSNLNEQDWRRVEENEIWKLPEFRDRVFVKLQESYNDLPAHLKRCFVYCSLLPKGKLFSSLELIHLWMAHGVLVAEKNDHRSIEDIGLQYFRELCSRSFFQMKTHGWNYSFSMYYFIHDFALFLARNECLIVRSHYTDVPDPNVRHLSIAQQLGDEIPPCLKELNSVRTIFFQFPSTKPFITSFFNEYLIKNYKNLRMLDLSNSSFETLPGYIGRMKRLRCFNLSFNRELTKLPGSISKLQSLQSLQLQECSKLETLPANIKLLSTSLVFLSITTTEGIFPANGIQALTSLRTLMIVRCNKLAYLPPTMARLTALKILVITDCENLCLYEDKHNKDGTFSLQKLILEKLPKALAFPRWFEGSKQSLQFLGLYGCPKLTKLPEWLPNSTSLPKIEISECPHLHSLPEGMHQLTQLPEQQNMMIRKEPPEIGDSGRTRKVWTEDENGKLIQTISELYGKGKWKVEDNFKLRHLEAIKGLLVHKLSGSDHDLSTKHIESQIKSLKESFHIVHEIISESNSSNFRWDSEKKMVIAEKEVWDAYVESHPEAEPFRDKAFPFYRELSTIFGEDAASATRKGLEIILAKEVEESNESLGRKNSVEGEYHEEDDLKSSSFSEAPQMVPTWSSNGLSKEKSENAGNVAEAIKEAAFVIAGEIKDSTNRLNQGLSQEINEKFMKLNNELMNITTQTVTARPKITHLISKIIPLIIFSSAFVFLMKKKWNG